MICTCDPTRGQSCIWCDGTADEWEISPLEYAEELIDSDEPV